MVANPPSGGLARRVAGLGRWCARHRWLTLGAVLAAMLFLGPLGPILGAGFSDDFTVPGADSQAATDLLQQRFPQQAGDTTMVVFAAGQNGALTPGTAGTAATETVKANLSGLAQVQAVTPLQVSPDGRIAFTTVQHTLPAQDLSPGAYQAVKDAARPAVDAGLEVSYRGSLVTLQGPQPVPVGEVLGILAAIIILTLLFRSVAAMLVSLLSAVIAIATGTLLLTLLSSFVSVPTVAPTLVVMLGLGAGIDYALFMVARFRERLRQGDDPVAAAGHSAGSTGVAVLAAGAIVVISISGLFVTGIPMIARMGLAAGLVVAVCAFSSVTVVPALLALAGRRVLPRAERRAQASGSPAEGTKASRLAEIVTGRPVVWTVVVTAVLLGLSAAALDLRLGNPDDGTRPPGDTRRTAYDRLTEGFGPGFNGPLLLAADLPGDPSQDQQILDRLQNNLATNPAIATTTPAQTNSGGDTAVLTVIPASKPQDKAISDLVTDLRETIIPAAVAGTDAQIHVGGITATFDDLADTVADRLVWLIAVVVGLSLILLTVLFRSIWLPIISAAFNLLSIGAAYGVVTLAFQTPTGASLVGASKQPVIAFVPMLMFAILFGLSMDYNVFLLSRVREQWLATGNAASAVTTGIQRTAAVITAAGAIMILVFTGFILEDQSEIKMIGLGLAVAILIDVTLVRLILTPAVLHLLGPRAWAFPRLLQRLPSLDLHH